MGRRRKTRAEYIIQYALKAKQQREGNDYHSDGEIKFNEYQEDRKMGLVWDKKISVTDLEADKKYDLQIDFLRPDGKGGYDIAFEIDGVKFHKKKTKEHWKDRLKNESGLKVIHIPSEAVTKKKFWPILDAELPKAILSKERVVYIDELA